MRLTLLKAKEALKNKAPADKLEWRINRAHERMLLHGKFVGSIVRMVFVVRYGNLTPPRFIKAVHGVKKSGCGCGCPSTIANRWFDFMPGKCNANDFCLNLVHDMGDGHPIMSDLPEGGDIRVSFSESEAPTVTPVITIYGLDSDMQAITLTITGEDTVANPFLTITRIHKEGVTPPNVHIDHIDDDSNVTPLAVMDATEEETYYHRYKMPCHANTAETTVETICKLRHIEFRSEQDCLYITNISALELAMDALQFEAENDHTNSDKYLLKAVNVLNQELKETNSAHSIPTIQFRHIGAVPNFKFGY